MKKFFHVYLILFLTNNYINCTITNCFEYSCEECNDEYFGSCVKCRRYFRLVDGTCPCFDHTCALCQNGLAGLSSCSLCKNGYYINDGDCICEIDDCEICLGVFCLKCKTGYYYNRLENKCEKETETNRVNCFDPNCDTCSISLEGGCETCKPGYAVKKGACIKMPIPDENLNCGDGYYYDEEIESCQEICDGVVCTQKKFYYYECPSNECLVCTSNILQVYSLCDNSDICLIETTEDTEGTEGCLNCITPDNCLICNQGYYLLGGKCKKCINGCSYCLNDNSCIMCLSGYELNSQNECIPSSQLDFNTDIYKVYKNNLFSVFYPEEYKTNLNIEIPECDIRCSKCYQNTGICKECTSPYKLENNKCIKSCSDENCLECTIEGSKDYCTKCKEGYIVKSNQCIYNCTSEGCLLCTLEDEQEICSKCDTNYSLDESQHKCKKNINYISIAFSVIIIIILIICIIAFCLYRKKRYDYRRNLLEMRRMYMSNQAGGVINVYNRNPNAIEEGSDRIELSKEQLADEFEIQKNKMEKGHQMCKFCNKKAGKYKCDCGCIVCKEHSILKSMEGESENYKVCFACEKIVKKVAPIKYDCHICMQKKINVAHFKCECALEVCKDCYIKCKMANNKCPGCRAII